MIALSLLSLLLAPAALAASVPWRRSDFQGLCQVSQSDFSFPTGDSGLDPLTGPPSLVLLGVGTQNYTCNSNGTFDSAGAVVQLFDISCLDGKAGFNTIPSDSLGVWNAISDTNPMGDALVQAMQAQFNLTVTGQHFFQSQDGKLIPVWDLRSSGEFQGNPGAFVDAHVLKDIRSPDGDSNVDWLELAGDSGELAKIIYRVNTASGQPAPTCNPGDTSNVKFSTKYLLL